MNMVHIAGIDKGPVLDWTDDNGLKECYHKWRKRWKSSLRVHSTTPMIQLNATTSFIKDTGIELVENGKLKENH